MTPAEMAQAFDACFKLLQEQVPATAKYRDSDMCGKYACYIGALEGLIKTYVPVKDRARVIRDLQTTVNKL